MDRCQNIRVCTSLMPTIRLVVARGGRVLARWVNYDVYTRSRSNLKTGLPQPGHVNIVLDITAVDFDQISLYSTGTMIIYDRFNL